VHGYVIVQQEQCGQPLLTIQGDEPFFFHIAIDKVKGGGLVVYDSIIEHC
jgi:hypothetical protein